MTDLLNKLHNAHSYSFFLFVKMNRGDSFLPFNLQYFLEGLSTMTYPPPPLQNTQKMEETHGSPPCTMNKNDITKDIRIPLSLVTL